MALTDLTRISTSGIATGSTIDAPILRKDVSLHGSQVGVVSALFDSSDDALEFNDNVKLKLGNDGDLSLYHTGTDSYIKGSSSGELIIRHNAITMQAISTSDTYFDAIHGGSVSLFWDNSKKFETTSHGAVITGVLTATSFSGGLNGASVGNVYASSGISTFYDLRVSNNLTVEGTTTTLDTNLIGVDRVNIGANSDTDTAIVGIQSGTADIVNLFDGTTEVLTVTSSGRVGINTTTDSMDGVTGNLNIANTNFNNHTVINLSRNTASDRAQIRFQNTNGNIGSIDTFGSDLIISSGNELKFRTNGTEALTIKSNQRVGIGTNAPDGELDVRGTIFVNGDGTGGRIFASGGSLSLTDGNGRQTLQIDDPGSGNSHTHVFNSSGQLGINTSPGAALEVNSGDSYDVAIFNSFHADGPLIPIQKSGTNIGFIGSGKNLAPATGGASDLALRSQGDLIFTSGGGVEKLRINTTGDIRIPVDGANGLSSQQGVLRFVRTAYSNYMKDSRIVFDTSSGSNNTDNNTYCSVIAGTRTSSFNGSSDLRFYTCNSDNSYVVSEKLRILEDGKVGIGITNPRQTLEINASHDTTAGAITPVLRLSSGTSYGGHDTGSGLEFGTTNATYPTWVKARMGATYTGSSNYGGHLVFQTNTGSHAFNSISEKMRIKDDGKVGIGATDPTWLLTVQGSSGTTTVANKNTSGNATFYAEASNSNTAKLNLFQAGTSGYSLQTGSVDALQIFRDSTYLAQFDSSGRFLIGHTASDNRDGYNSALQVSGTTGDTASISIGRWSDDASYPALTFSKSRNSTIGSHEVVDVNDYLGGIQFQGDDGSNYHVGASILARVESGVGNDDMPAFLSLRTNQGNASEPVERMIIHGGGNGANILHGGRVDVLGYQGTNITGGTNSNVLNEQFLVCPSAADGYDDNHTITFGQTKGNWEAGTSSSYDTSFGLLWNWGNTGGGATRVVRAGIHYDHKGTEKFKIWSSYGDILFKVDSGQSGNETSETCDTKAMQITHDGEILTPNQVGCAVRISTTETDHPGNNSFENNSSIMPFDTEVWDIGSNFDTSNYTFTVPQDGRYLCCYTIQLEQITNWQWLYIFPVVNGSNSTTGSAGVVYADHAGTSADALSNWTYTHGDYHMVTNTIVMNLTAGQTVTLRTRGTITCKIKGGAESQWTMQLLG